MRLPVPLLLCCLLTLAGCAPRGTVDEGAATPPEPAPTGTAGEPPEAAGELPACDPQPFALEGYEVKVAENADLDGDGQDECIVGCQGATVDEVGEPTDPAYFTLAHYADGEWQEWFSIPAPGDERFVDEESVVAAEDLNDDGIVELALQFYGFGVSSRPQTLYVWQITDDGSESAIQGDAVAATSDDGLLVQDIDDRWPGQELVFAIAQMGDEAHAAPHRYKIVVYGWKDALYRKVATATPARKFAGHGAALEAYVGNPH